MPGLLLRDGGINMHGIITMLRALRYDLEKEGHEDLLEEYEDTICTAEDLLMDSMKEGW